MCKKCVSLKYSHNNNPRLTTLLTKYVSGEVLSFDNVLLLSMCYSLLNFKLFFMTKSSTLFVESRVRQFKQSK